MATAMPSERSRSVTPDSRRSLPVTRWPMAWSTVAMALMPAPPTPTMWTRWTHRRIPQAVGRGGPRRCLRPSRPSPPVGRWPRPPGPRPAAASGRPSALGRPSHGHQAVAGRPAAPRPPGARPAGVQAGSGSRTAAPTRSSTRALAVWWSPGAPGSGTSTAGTPATASSATVMAPARHTTRSAAAYTSGHPLLVGDPHQVEAVGTGPRPGQAVDPVAGGVVTPVPAAHDVVDRPRPRAPPTARPGRRRPG